MLPKSVKLLLLFMATGLVGACSTPCGAPGKLCAPISSNTSAPPAVMARLPERPPEPPPPEAQTYAVAMPDTGTTTGSGFTVGPSLPVVAKEYRIGLMLPLRSETLGPPANAVRAGFMAAWERDRDGFAVTVIETGEAAQDVLAIYAGALEQQDMIVGPLARSAVTAIAASALVQKPTIALNHPEARGDTPLPPQMLVIGLSIEDEARQAADWAAQEQRGAIALILSGSAPWQRRSASAFGAQWQRLGMAAKVVEMSVLNGYLSDGELVQLRARLQGEPGTLLFAALDPDQLRQLRVALAAPPLSDIPIYGTSSLNPGKSKLQAGPELDGVRLLDLPWQLQRDHPAVMVYPQPGAERKFNADMERLYALGIDAFRVAREVALHPVSRFNLDGVTGQLQISFGDGAASFERRELPAVYKNGVPLPVQP
ncbi:MAG: penicillin-binding protein activator [Pseudomonadota bacterium]